MNDAVVFVRSGQGESLRGQLRLLTHLIEHAPDVPVHYVLRGEAWLLCGDVDRARDDFLTARRLAQAQAATSDWGYLAQAYVDRCEAGLRCCNLELVSNDVNYYHGSDF